MLTPTDHPRVYEFALRDWNPQQANSKTGHGTRTELICRVTFHAGKLDAEYVGTRFYRRDTPAVAWARGSQMVQPQTEHMTFALAAGLHEVLLGFYPLEIRWNTQTSNF